MATAIQNPMLVDPEMKEIVDSFIVETKEILERLDTDLVELEKSPEDTELLNSIFRSFHTIKGTSGFLSLERLTKVTHRCEDLLNKLRKGEVKLNSTIMDAILLAYDKIKALLITIEEEKSESVEITDTVETLSELLKSLEEKKGQPETVKTEPVVQPVVQQQKVVEEPPVQTEPVKAQPETKPEAQPVTEVKKPSVEKVVEKEKPKVETTIKSDNTIRVDVERLDELLNIVSELVLGRNRLTQVNSEVSLEYEGTKFSRDLGEVTKQIDLMTNELQLVVMKTRMVKIGKVFNRFPRLVRDLSKESKKEINLVIKGEETELDKTLIEEIYDPLVHLVRNAVDHAIELPEKRIEAGKDKVGTITLAAEHEGNNIIISIEDDGKGIDPDWIKEKAVSKDLISKERAKELSKQDALNLIFLPGFSTAEVVTNISGRGVGMDVVKTNVAKLRGMINIDSVPGKGTKISVKLPLTLAIIPGMIVEVNQEKLVIPLNSVLEVLRVHIEDIYSINQRPVIKMRDSVLPLVSVDELMSRGNNKPDEKIWQYVVVVGIAEKKYGIKVDHLIGQKEVVIKSLGNYLGTVQGVAGSTIMGDGTVIVILDITELINKFAE